MSVLLRGSQRPTLCHEPPGAVNWQLSDIAVDWAREVGGYTLDEWQEWLVRWTFARRADGLWAARDVGAEVTRQSGKNIWLEVVELAGVYEFKDRLITHSAHRADVSHEHFLSMRERIEGSDELMRAMPVSANRGFVTTNGNESICLASGARVLFKARAQAAGRGPRPQKVVFDEALVLAHGQIGSMAPAVSAQANPQIILASSSPKADSEVLHSFRARAAVPVPGDRLFYAAWNNPADVDTSDLDAWYRVNPSLGYGRMTEESLWANSNLMTADEFRREHLGVPEEPAGRLSLVPNWADLLDEESRIVSDRHIALDVSPDRRFACLAWAGRRADGLLHVEAFEHQPRTAWVVDKCKLLWEKWRLPIRIQTGSAAAALGPLLEAEKIDVVEVTAAQYGEAVGQFLLAVEPPGQLRHVRNLVLERAVAGAEVRHSGDVDVWARRSSKADITPLVATTLALGGVPVKPRRGLFLAVT